MQKSKTDTAAILFPIVLIACGVLAAAGLYLCLNDPLPVRQHLGLTLLACGAVGAIMSVIAWGLAVQLRNTRESATAQNEQLTSLMADRLSAMSVMLNVVTEQQVLSDRAKAVAYREKDRDALRRAIREEMGRGDWEAARVLVDDMEATFGYRQEAERFRVEISQHRQDGIRRQLTDAQGRLERLYDAQDWTGAHAEASRFITQFPDFEPARKLPADIEARRQQQKRKLMDRWNDCVTRHDGDEGMRVLKALDPYLTPAEGERMAESARSIFNDRKARLRDSITAAMAAGNWAEAIRIGEVIQTEFPNAKFAQEVRDMMTTFRQRAANSEPAQPAGV